jgi:hypothetical protein
VFVLHPHSVSALKSHVDAQAMPLPCALVSVSRRRGLLYIQMRLTMSPGTCPAKSIAWTENLDHGCFIWPPQHVLVEKGR